MRTAAMILLGLALIGCDSRPHPTLALDHQKVMSMVGNAAFQSAFTAEPQCKGITLLTSGEDRADFVAVFDLDATGRKEKWVWTLRYPHDPTPESSEHPAHGVGGIGYREKAEDAVRDVCLTIWDDVHAPYPVNPGGRVQ